MLLLLSILIIIFIVFYCINYMEEKNYSSIELFGDLKKEKSEKMKKDSLLSLFNDISSANKVILENIKEEWLLTKDVMEKDIESKIREIIQTILNSISNVSEYRFFFNNIENMYVMKDSNGNYRCILNCFVYEVKKYYTLKLSMDVVYYDGEVYFNFIDVDESSIASILDKYSVKYDGAGILTNHEMFDKNTKDILDNYYYTNYDIVFLNNRENDIDKTSLYTITQLKNKYLPANIPTNPNHPYFCNKNKLKWDPYGIKENNDKNCVANDNTYGGIPNTPTNGPNRITSNPDNNIHKWLFSKSMGPLISSGQY